MMNYTNPECVAFVEDMEAAGFEVEHYHGRFFWRGPAVRTEEPYVSLQDVMRATSVRLQWDSLGRDDRIVYPVASDSGGE